MYCYLSDLADKIAADFRIHIVLAVMLPVATMLGGCHTHPGMSFEQDRPMNTSIEQDFFREPFIPQASLPSQPTRVLKADYTEEENYLKNIVQLLEQSKIIAANAEQQVRPQQPKVFNYDAYEIDIDTVIFAVKRYLAADDYTPRGFEALPPTRLKAHYSDVE